MAEARQQPALVRAVDAMMRGLGGASVQLRIASEADGSTQRDLGIAAPFSQEVVLAPVVVRTPKSKATAADESVRATRTRIEVLIASSTLEHIMPAFGAAEGLSFLRQARQIVYMDDVFTVTDVSADRFAGLAYLYRVTGVSSQ